MVVCASLVKTIINNNLEKKQEQEKRNIRTRRIRTGTTRISKRGSYDNGEGPAINRGGIRGVRHFACKFPQKVARCVADVVTKPCNNYFKQEQEQQQEKTRTERTRRTRTRRTRRTMNTRRTR
jgi:hypothetical protein